MTSPPPPPPAALLPPTGVDRIPAGRWVSAARRPEPGLYQGTPLGASGKVQYFMFLCYRNLTDTPDDYYVLDVLDSGPDC